VPRVRALSPEVLLPDPVLLRVHVATRVLELTERAAGGDLAAQAELEALAALLEAR
jgi:hypothetical protein